MNKRASRKQKDKIFIKFIRILSLFFIVITIGFAQIFPDDIKISATVHIFRIVGDALGVLGALYLIIVTVWKFPFDKFKTAFLQLGGLLGSYVIFHLFLELTYSINDTNFKYDFNFLIIPVGVTALLLIIALIVEILPSGFSSKTALSAQEFKAGVLAGFLFIDSFSTRMIWNVAFGPTNSRGVVQFADPKVVNQATFASSDFLRMLGDFIFVFIIVLVMSVLLIRGFSDMFKRKSSFSLAFTTSLLLAYLFNYFIQYGNRVNTPFYFAYQGYMVGGSGLFQVLILTLIFLMIYLIINRFMIGTILIIVVFAVFSIANMIKFSLRQEPIYLSELSWLKNPQTLFSFVSIWIIAVIFVGIIVLGVLAFFLNRKFFKGRLTSWKIRIGVVLVSMIFIGALGHNFKDLSDPENYYKIPILSRYMNVGNGDALWKGMPYTARTKSQAFFWMRQAFGSVMEKPAGYSEAKVKSIAKEYTAVANKINKTRTENINQQTVIYVLSESLANPNRVAGVMMSENPLSNIDQVISSQSGGLMYSNGYGGGTANMEAQSLSGLPMTNYSSQVSIINSDVIPKMNFVPVISNYFTNKIALHPENASNYNRNVIYKKFGFQHFYALSSTDKKDILKNQTLLDGKVSDAQTYQDVIGKIQPNKNQFFSVMTMQNHMPFTQYTGSSRLTASGSGYNSATNTLLQNYSRKIDTTDDATKTFLDNLQKINKKITVVFYGDHLPSLYPVDSAFKKHPLTQYETDYFIWSNQGNQKNIHQNLNSSEFTPALLETQNAKVSPYYALLTEVMNNLPAQYDSALGDSVKLNSKQEKLRQDLKMIQYDLTEGKGYLKSTNGFYQLPK